jgi:asparagine synthase (glutamine-hydrolysing)
VDSSLIAAMAAEARGRDRVCSLSVGFPERSYDERPPARRIARALGIAHVEVQADRATLAATLDEITGTLAEPIADPALLPTLVLARVAREHVGVVLSGEGADELFWGYPTYLGHRCAPGWSRLPAAIGAPIAALLAAVPISDAKVPVRHLLARFTAHAGDEPVRRHVAWFGTGLLPWLEPPATAQLDLTLPPGDDVVRRLALFDYGTYLRDGLLPKIDRATMRAGLEARAPYLDSAVTAFALSLPAHLKLRGMTQKWILKRVARARLPAWVSRRRKRGLSVPIAAWLRGPLRGEVERLADGIVGSHLLNPERIGQLASDHLARRADHARALWALVVYARFHQRWIGGA